jgi:hypothetical protein
MGPINLVLGHRQELGLRPLLHWLARERSWGMDPWIDQSACCGLCRDPFSQEQWDLSKSDGVSRKVVTYGDRLQEAYAGCTWTDMGSVRVVLVGFIPAWYTSIQITVTLEYE